MFPTFSLKSDFVHFRTTLLIYGWKTYNVCKINIIFFSKESLYRWPIWLHVMHSMKPSTHRMHWRKFLQFFHWCTQWLFWLHIMHHINPESSYIEEFFYSSFCPLMTLLASYDAPHQAKVIDALEKNFPHFSHSCTQWPIWLDWVHHINPESSYFEENFFLNFFHWWPFWLHIMHPIKPQSLMHWEKNFPHWCI
jgi:hypothetical protein